MRSLKNWFFLPLLLAVLHPCQCAIKEGHQGKHHYTQPSVDVKEDIELWKQAFGTGVLVPVKDSKRIFKKHFDMIHDEGKLRQTGELHDIDDGSEFAQMVQDTRSWDLEKMMTFDEFWQALQDYIQIKIQERAYLTDFSVM
uniref:EF-hand domain-containing protein n=1 Tax=Guillardia theta TaxID=55529 RepID=A0A6U6BI35_GUITH|mmetsp:Transcript_38356/g.120771  ORF Transcript_38356/g.120771 Transcript_38356/m.120771 type:complete len:141 (+) Transcript_38356:37-459(+)